MSVVGNPAADGTVQVHCPRPGCSAVLKVKPKSAKSWVTCAAEGCGHRFVLEVPETTAGPPPVPKKDTFALSDDGAPQPAKPRPERARRKRVREEELPARTGKTAAIVAGGAVAVLLLGGGLTFGLIWLLKDKDTGPAGPVSQAPAPALSAPIVSPEPVRAKDPPVGTPKVPASNSPKGGWTIEPSPAPATGTPAPADTTPDEPPPAGSPPPNKGPISKKGPTTKNVVISGDATERVKKSTALIERKNGWGTGFVIKPGIVMTNFHVISGAMLDELKVSFVSLEDTAPAPLKPTLLYCNPERDLAIFKVDTDRPPLEMCPTGTELTGLDVAIVGNPRGAGGQADINKVTVGLLAAPVRRNAAWTYYELNCQAFFGNSGGPVVDRKTGKLVGVVQSILGDGKATSYCIPFGEANRALDRLPKATDGEPAAVKVAAARHYLDYFSTEMPILEDMAVLGMQLQLNVLKFGSGNVSVRLKNGGSMSAAEVTAKLKEDHAKTYLQLQRVLDGAIKASPEVPSSLVSLARTRLEACGSMRAHASSKTETEVAYRKQMDTRTAKSDSSARAFQDDYKKFLDKLDPAGK